MSNPLPHKHPFIRERNFMSEITQKPHKYFAQAQVIGGNLNLPIKQTVSPQAVTNLPETGGYSHVHSLDYRLEGVVRYDSAYTHVAGSPALKPGKGPQTLITTVIEGLNVMEILTADRIVGQIILDHPLEGHVPGVAFLGTRFENLCIAGEYVDLQWDQDILGEKPANDQPYTTNPGVISRVSSQYERILGTPNLPPDLEAYYNQLAANLGKPESLECSLINLSSGQYPGLTFGNVLKVRHFGTMTLGKVVVTCSDFDPSGTPQQTLVNLTMIDLKMGCIGDGNLPIGGGTGGGSHLNG
jgi:hypothetical protein